MFTSTPFTRSSLFKAIIAGGLAAGILDAIDAIAAFKLVLGFDPIPIYQFVASGLLGPSAFKGGASTALLGLAIHFLIAFSAASAFVLASMRLHALRRSYVAFGLAHGVAVFAFMNYVVIPLSAIPPSPFSLPLFLNGVIGHAFLVGLPISYCAHRYLGVPDSGSTALTIARPTAPV